MRHLFNLEVLKKTHLAECGPGRAMALGQVGWIKSGWVRLGQASYKKLYGHSGNIFSDRLPK